jgi:NifU-like protein involved in Fe-S cluster formation
MQNEFEKKVADAIANPKNMGELDGADAVGSVGSPGCGDMVRMWVKFKEENGKKVIDRATFQTFGCETAIAVASLATELVRGKTPDEALALSGEELAASLGPLPPMKIHCGQLVEGALRSALSQPDPAPAKTAAPAAPAAGSLLDRFAPGSAGPSGKKIVFLDGPSSNPS